MSFIGARVASFASGEGAVINRFRRAAVQASQTHGAVLPPTGKAVGIQTDVSHRASFGTQTAFHTFVGYPKWLRRGEQRHEQRIEHAGLKPCEFALNHIVHPRFMPDAPRYVLHPIIHHVEFPHCKIRAVGVKTR